MIKQIAAVRRKPGMTHSEFRQYIEHVHGDLARAKPLGVKKYLKNHVFDGAYGAKDDPRYELVFGRDSVTELWFENLEALGETFADPYVREVIGPDGRNFSDLGTALGLLVEEVPMEVPDPGHGAAKVLHFLKKAESLEQAEFERRWSEAHAAIMEGSPSVAEQLRGYVQNRPLPGGAGSAYFGGAEMPTYEGIASMWFDGPEALPAFRDYHRGLEEISRSGEKFIDVSRSFFLYAREVPIYDLTT